MQKWLVDFPASGIAYEEVNTPMVVQSDACSLKALFAEKFDLDFFQREYVWQSKDVDELVKDLSNAFLENYRDGDALTEVLGYNPYYMGEVVLSQKSGKPSSIIDGQQRITTLTLFLIYLIPESVKLTPVMPL